MGVDVPGSAYTPFGGGAERSGPLRPGALAAALGGTSVLLAASVLGWVLALAEKARCWSGAGNGYARQFQRACYPDISPLYYGEGLSAGKVPYTGHKVEYPVLIGGAMQAAAWLVRNVSAVDRGGAFFGVTVALLAVCAVAGVLPAARAAAPAHRAPALMVALSPALILNPFFNWAPIALALAARGGSPDGGRQVGPDRAGAARGGAPRGGGPPHRMGGYPARPGGGGQVLPAGGLRAPAAALPAGRPDAPVRAGPGRGRARLAGGRPAGDDRRALPLGLFLSLQHGPGRRPALHLV